MTVTISELRELLEAAQRYLDGACSIQELNGRVGALADAARLFNGHSVLFEIVSEWSNMVDRHWNEWGHVIDPVSEEAFRAWLIEQSGFPVQTPRAP